MFRVFFCLVALAVAGAAQRAESLKNVKSIYVGKLGGTHEAPAIEQALREQIKKSHQFKLVTDPSAADAVIAGNGEIYVKGHFNLNPRRREIGHDTQTVYGGFLSVELQGRNSDTLWSYLSTPPTQTGEDLSTVLAKRVVGKLTEAIRKESK